MPRVVRDSDDDVEAKSSGRKTRASSVSSSVASDSPVTRRTTRSNKQLSVIESSPESSNNVNSQQTGRTTRSRTATLDKSGTATTRNLRSRKNSASSEQNELIEFETEVSQKRVTRNMSALLDTGTPTKTNLRSRSIRAGSEAKSTPPPRNKRGTRASSVDPVGSNELTGTPVKRVTRSSMVALQPTVTEEQEAKNEHNKSLENTVVEVDEDDSETVLVPKKEKSSRKSKMVKETDEDSQIEADGESVSSPRKLDQSKDSANEIPKEQKKQRRKIKLIPSESEEFDENLFQDVLPEEYTSKRSSNGKSAKAVVLNKSENPDNSNVNQENQGLNDSLKKKSHKSIEESQDSEKSVDTVIENTDVKDEDSNKSLSYKKNRRSTNKSLELNQSYSKQKKDESISEKLSKLNSSEQKENDIAEESSSESKSLNKNRKSSDKSMKRNQSSLEENHNESGSDTLDKNRSPNKNNKSLNKSVKNDDSMSEAKKNESTSEKLSTSLNDPKSPKRQSLANLSLKSLPEKQIEEPVEDEPMDVDEPMEVDEISDQNENESANDKTLNKSRQSLHKSQLNNSKNESISEKLSTSLNNSKTHKRRSLENSKSNSSSRSSAIEDDKDSSNNEDSINENDNANDKTLNKSPQSLNKSQLNKSKNESISEKSSTSFNNSKTSKRFSLDNSKSSSSNRSNAIEDDEDSSNSEDCISESPIENRNSLTKKELQDKNASIKETLAASLNDSKKDITLSKKLESLKEFTRTSLVKQDSVEIFSDNGSETKQATDTANKSKRLNHSPGDAESEVMSSKKKDTSLQDTVRKSLSRSVATSNLEDSSDSETEDNENYKKFNKSINRSLNISKKALKSANICLANSPAKASITENGEDLDTSDFRKSEPVENQLSKSIILSIERMKYSNPMNDVSIVAKIDSESGDENRKHIEVDSEVNSEVDSNAEVYGEDSVSETDSEDENNSKSLDSDVDREYNFLGKDITTFSDDDVPGDDCRASEEEFSDSEDEGEDLAKFIVSDAEVEGDENEDEDDDIEDDEDDEESNEEEVESADKEELSEAKIKNEKFPKLFKSTKDKSINDSKSLKNKSANFSKTRLLEMEDSESDDDTFSKLMKDKISINDSKSLKNKSANLSNTRLLDIADFEADDDYELANRIVNNKSLKDANSSNLLKNKSLNNSKMGKVEKDLSILSTSKNAYNNSKSAKNECATINESQSAEESDSEIEEAHQSQIQKISVESSSEDDSKSENFKDSYRIILSEPINPSEPRVQNKTLGRLIECSTPKVGMFKKNTDRFVDKDNSISIVNDKSSISTRRKSVSLDNLMDTKSINSRLSIQSTKDDDSSKIQVEINANGSPEAVLKHRQSWKLVPLNKTVQPLGDESPDTRYLKKLKFNDTLPILQSMRSGSVFDNEEPKKTNNSKSMNRKIRSFTNAEDAVAAENKKSKTRKSLPSKTFENAEDSGATARIDAIDEKSQKRKSLPSRPFVNAENAAVTAGIETADKMSKKRKLGEISHIASLEDDSMIKIGKKKKKRARVDESADQDDEVKQIQEFVQTEVGKTKKKKNKSMEEQEQKKKNKPMEAKEKKKKNKVKADVINDAEEVLEYIENRDVKQKKKKKSKSFDTADVENVESIEIKQKKKKKNKSLDDLLENEENIFAAEVLKFKKKKSRLSDEKAQQELELTTETVKPKKKKSRSSEERSDQENCIGEVTKIRKKSKRSSDSKTLQTDKKSKKKKKITTAEPDDDEAPEDVGFEDAKRSALIAMQQAADGVQAMKVARKKKQQEHIDRMHKQEPVRKASLKRLPEDVLDNLTDEPALGQPHKRQKLSKNKERRYMMPSTSMFSPGKPAPSNLKVDDDYIELSDAGGTTQFGVINLAKANKPKVSKSSIAALTFRQKMLARNQRQPMSAYHVYQKKLKAKSGL